MSPMTRRPAVVRKLSWTFCCYLAYLNLAGHFGCTAPRAAKAPIAPTQQDTRPATATAPEPWRNDVPPAGADTPWTYPIPIVTALANQLTVYVLKRPSGPVSLSLVVRHGGSDVSASKCGLANLTAQLLVEATKTKNHHLLSETAEALGSTLVGDANRDFLRLTLDTLGEDVESGIGLLAEALLTPAFDREDFRRLQKQQLDDLVSERQNPSRMASLVGLQAALGERLGAPVGGRLSSVRKLTVEDIRRWHQRYVYPNAVALFVVGPVEPNAVLAAAERNFGSFRGKKPTLDTPLPAPAPSATSYYLVDRPGSVQSAVFVAQAYPKRSEAGYAARQVLDNVIGGQFTSRINQNLREEHAYTYGARSLTIATRNFGLLAISTSVETDVTAAAVQEIIKELRELRGPNPIRPILPEELKRARTGIVQSLGSHLEDGHRLLLDQEQLFVHGLGPAYLGDYLTEVRNLDGSALAKQADRLDPDHLTVVIVGDASRLGPQLEAVSPKTSPAPAEWLD